MTVGDSGGLQAIYRDGGTRMTDGRSYRAMEDYVFKPEQLPPDAAVLHCLLLAKN